MKITVYTITDCQFSKQEKEYLASHNLAYEEKNLETNKDFLTEMLAVSNNFAGTPVTRIEKDDGSIIVLKGFTKEEFDAALELNKSQTTTATAPVTEAPPKPQESTSLQAPPAQAAPPPAPEMTPTPPAPDEKLESVLDKLEEKTTPEETAPPVTEAPPSNPPTQSTKETSAPSSEATPSSSSPPTETTTTAPPPTDTPAIPDFPQDTSPQPVK